MKSSYSSIPVEDQESLLPVDHSIKKNSKLRYLVLAAGLVVLGVGASIVYNSGGMKPQGCGQNWWLVINQRSREQYSTMSKSLADLALPGAEFVISPKDLFDTILPDGESAFNEATEEKDMIGIIGSDALKVWAENSLGHGDNHHIVVSKPSKDLVDKTLVVKSAKLLPVMKKVAIGHQVEGAKYLSHVPKEEFKVLEIMVGVSDNDENNPTAQEDEKLFVGCHGDSACHIMNVGDEVYGI